MQRSKAMSEQALASAALSGNREVIAEALTARMYALSGPDDIDALLAASYEMLALDSEPRGWISVEAYTAQHCALMHRGDLVAADAALEALGEIAKTRGFLELRWHYERHCAQRRFLAGDFAAAKSEFVRLEAAAVRVRCGDGAALGGIHRAVLKIVTRGPRAFAPGENPDAIRAGMRPTRAYACYHANLARLALAFDKPGPARQVLDELAVDDFGGVPKNLGYLNTLCNLALVAIRLADRTNAERLYRLLAPYSRHNTPNNLSFYDGPVAHFLALLAAFLERDDRAARHFAQAIEITDRLGLRPLLARSCFECARWSLQMKSDVRATARGVALRSRALELSEELGMQWLAEEVRALAVPKRAR
jgi:hypothetical protein